MRTAFSLLLIFTAINVFAAPLEDGYALAPKTAASPEEKTKAYTNARQRVIEASKKYEGVPYRYSGMTSKGLDCSGFICLSFKDALGVSLPRSAAGLHSWAEATTLEKAQPGDLLFFKTDRSGKITHVALYLGERRFIHAASAGSKTGVIYSSLSEKYWADAYAGAGRAFPETSSDSKFDNDSSMEDSDAGAKRDGRSPAFPRPENDNVHLLAGVALAPTWNSIFREVDMLRGITSQFCFCIDSSSSGQRMVLGFELRPEYDKTFGVFRLPITISFGTSEKLRFFAGPLFSFGDASLTIDGKEHRYSNETSLLGIVGVTAAPFVIKLSKGEFAPYVEASWQSYSRDNNDFDFAVDLMAGLHFSTGIRWLIKIL